MIERSVTSALALGFAAMLLAACWQLEAGQDPGAEPAAASEERATARACEGAEAAEGGETPELEDTDSPTLQLICA